jgi:methionyl-tRNA formyltransferase
MKVLFLGNHTLGVCALKALSQKTQIVGVVAHPEDSEDGVIYQSVFDFSKKMGWDVIRSMGNDLTLKNYIAARKPDLIWITDYKYLISEEIIKLAPFGAVNLHPSLLPKYRGRASINWAILKGEKVLGLTAHFVDAGMDTGDIIDQMKFKLTQEQDIGDALNILYSAYETITRRVICRFIDGRIDRVVQNHNAATVFHRRVADDGKINFELPAHDILNLIRAVSRPYPGAFFFYKKKKIIVWKALMSEQATAPFAEIGAILWIDENRFYLQCLDKAICVYDYEIQIECSW